MRSDPRCAPPGTYNPGNSASYDSNPYAQNPRRGIAPVIKDAVTRTLVPLTEHLPRGGRAPARSRNCQTPPRCAKMGRH